MLRRAPTILTTAFLALACLLGIPAASAGSGEPAAAAWNPAAIASKASIRGALTDDSSEISVGQRADEDDTPDPVIRTGSVFAWPAPAAKAQRSFTTATIGPSHQPCASPPRAPPAA